MSVRRGLRLAAPVCVLLVAITVIAALCPVAAAANRTAAVVFVRGVPKVCVCVDVDPKTFSETHVDVVVFQM